MGLIHWAKEKIEMKIIAALIERVFKNWITTVLGILLGFTGVISAVYNLIPTTLVWQGHNVANTLLYAAGISLALAGAIAKDENIGINPPTLPTKLGVILLVLGLGMSFPASIKAQSLSASTEAVATHSDGSWGAASHLTESFDFLEFGAKKTNHVYAEGHEFLASGAGFTLYGGGLAVEPDLTSFFKKTNIPSTNISFRLSASVGNKIPTVGSSHVAGLFGGVLSYQASSTVAINVLQAGVIVAPGSTVPYLSAGLTKYF